MSKRKNRKPAPVAPPDRMTDQLPFSIPELPGIITQNADIIGVKRMMDAYSNPPANLGMGANNLAQTSGYIMERFTWDYWTLNVLFRTISIQVVNSSESLTQRTSHICGTLVV